MSEQRVRRSGSEVTEPAWRRVPAIVRCRVLLLGNGQRANVHAEAARLRPLIEQHAEIVVSDFEQREDLQQVSADFAVVLGRRWFDSACGQAAGCQPDCRSWA